MKEKTRVLFQQELQNHVDIRLEIINKAILKYAELKGASNTHMKKHVKYTESNDIKYFHYQDDLIISIQNGFTVNKFFCEIRYLLNELIT